MSKISRMRDRMHAEYPIDPQDAERVKDLLASARLTLAVRKGGWIVSHLISMAEVILTRDPKFQTLAVMRIDDPGGMDDQRVVMLVNVDFVLQELGTCDSDEPVAFALNHERKHKSNLHLERRTGGDSSSDRDRAKSPEWILACEANINWELEQSGWEIPSRAGKRIVVDSDAVYRQYAEQAKKAGLTPMPKREFLGSEYTAYAGLKSLPKPPSQRMVAKACGTEHGEDEGEASGKDGLSDDMSDVMSRVFAAAVRAAEAGDKNAEQEVLEAMDKFPDASEFWSGVGASNLRGRTSQASKAANLWMRYVKKRIQSLLGQGRRWTWNRRLPTEDRFAPRGKERMQSGAVFVDSSGSMPQEVIDKVASMVGKIPNTEVHWHWFDASVGPFEPGGEILGGGGTSFDVIESHLLSRGEGEHRCCRRYPDFVVVLTDGFAPEMMPSRPQRWVWLVTKGGSMWPFDKGMAAYQVDI